MTQDDVIAKDKLYHAIAAIQRSILAKHGALRYLSFGHCPDVAGIRFTWSDARDEWYGVVLGYESLYSRDPGDLIREVIEVAPERKEPKP